MRGAPPTRRVEELFERWAERQAADGVAPDPEELCRESPELLPALRDCIRDYRRLERALAPPEDRDLEREAAAVPIGGTFSHYRIVAKIGEGGMGLVYRAEDTRIGRTVALKFLPRDLTRDADARDRFLREAQAASSLDHPHLCTIYEVDETADGQLFIAMAYYDGETLKERLERGALSLRDALVTALQVLEGLAAAHALGIVHRDLKPANVWITKEGRVKILDFGLAKLLGRSGLTRTGVVVGTCAYMSPEQIQGEGEVDPRADLWSAGVVLYEMLTGRLPFHAGRQEVALHSILHEPPLPIRSFRADVPEGLARIVSRALAKEPGDRHPSAEAMLADLRALRGALDEEPTRVGSLLSFPRPRRPIWLAAGLALPLLLTAGLAFVVWQQTPRAPPQTAAAAGAEARLLFAQGQAYEARGDQRKYLEVAEGLYRKAVAAEPGNPRLQAHLAALLARLQAQYPAPGRSEESRALADRALAADPSLVPAWEARARLALLDGDAAAAEQAARRAIQVGPDDYRGYCLLGESLVTQGRIDEGLGDLHHAVEVGGGAIEPRLALGRELMVSGRLNQAVVELEDVLRYAPDSPNALGNLANIYLRTGRDADAVTLYRRQLELEPSDRPANNLGVALLYLGRIDEAIAAFREAHRMAPEKASALSNLGDAYQRRGDPGTARSWYQQELEKLDSALAAGGPRPLLLARRGVCLAKLRRFDEARRSVGEALELETNGLNLFHAAQISSLAGDRAETLRYVERALAAGFPRGEFLRDLSFDNVRADARFRALLEN